MRGSPPAGLPSPGRPAAMPRLPRASALRSTGTPSGSCWGPSFPGGRPSPVPLPRHAEGPLAQSLALRTGSSSLTPFLAHFRLPGPFPEGLRGGCNLEGGGGFRGLSCCPAPGFLNNSGCSRPVEGTVLCSPPGDAPCLEGSGQVGGHGPLDVRWPRAAVCQILG